MFETFEIPSYYFVNQAVLSLMSTGRQTGIVIDSGYDQTRILPKKGSLLIPDSNSTFDCGGKDLTTWLMKFYNEKGYIDSNNFSNNLVVNEIKEKYCYVASDFELEEQKQYQKGNGSRFEIPNGEMISIGGESFQSPEMLFKPSLNGKNFEGIHNVIFNTINKCEKELQKELYENIILTGGNCMLTGLSERLEKEISNLISSKVKVSYTNNPKYGAWIGGAMISTVPNFSELVITKEEYD